MEIVQAAREAQACRTADQDVRHRQMIMTGEGTVQGKPPRRNNHKRRRTPAKRIQR